MTHVTVRKSELGIPTGFTVLGHSGYADAGEDVVCAAVSILVINTINSIESFTDDSFELVSNEEDGLIDVRFESAISDETALLLNSMILGLTTVQDEYGSEYLHVGFEEV